MKKILTALLLNLTCILFAVGFAACNGVEFKINFIVDGEIYATVNTNGAETIKMPDNPTKEDYRFDGWFWDKDTWQKPFTANSLLDAPLSSDMSVYAKMTYIGENTQPDTSSAGIEEYFKKQADGSYYGKVYNATDSFDFNGKIQSETDFYVCKDSACTQILHDNTTSLNLGDNVFYILFADGNKTTATVRRRIICTVNFDTANGTIIESQQVYEDTKAKMPKNPMRLGYTFFAWDFDFNQPITANTTITALWIANTNTPYKIEYYLQNLENDEYTLQESDTENLTGTTDTTATATKTYEHFNVIENTESGNINADGTTVLKVYYDLEKFNVNIMSSENVSLDKNYAGLYKYGSTITTITATFNNYLGYEWKGWYSNNEFITDNYTLQPLIVNKSINYIATSIIKNEMADFNFISTETTCTITGIKNTTLTEIVVPDYITSIDTGAFYGCNEIVKISLPVCFAYFGNLFMLKTAGCVPIYGSNYYYVPSSLTSVTISNSTYIGAHMFDLCSSLTTIIIPDSVTNIEDSAFSHCRSLTSIEIPDSVTSIGKDAFSYCYSLTSVTIGNSVTSIGEGAFRDCSSLISVYFNNKQWWKYGFNDNNLNDVNVDNDYDNATRLKKYIYYIWVRYE